MKVCQNPSFISTNFDLFNEFVVVFSEFCLCLTNLLLCLVNFDLCLTNCVLQIWATVLASKGITLENST